MQSVNLISDARYSDDKPNVLHAVKTDQLLVDGDHVRVTREEEKLGLNSSSTVDLVIEGARVGRDRLLQFMHAAGFDDVVVRFTHRVADGMHSAIVSRLK